MVIVFTSSQDFRQWTIIITFQSIDLIIIVVIVP